MQDDGYSNWTVEGTTANCLLKLNPSFPDDSFYGKAASLQFAQTCSRFSHGDPVTVDVDHEEGELEAYSEDPEIQELLKAFRN